jgi:protoporphyrinogen/coproporphyrinogen III oxidase
MSLTTVVVGAGITGLAAAHRLAQLAPDDVIIVCEASPRLGGKVHGVDLSESSTPLSVDVGAESMLARRPEGTELITELGLDDHLVHPTPARAQAYLDGEVRPLPPSNMGIPTDLDALDGYLSPAGLARARAEVDLPAAPLDGDVGIGGYVAERFGDEVTDRLLEPMLGGVYAGQARRLSFEAVHPALYAVARSGGSLLRAADQVAAAARRNNDASTTGAAPVFAGLRGGVSRIIGALADDLGRRGVQVLTNRTVRAIRRTPSGFELITGSARDPETIIARRVVLATPAAPTSRLLGRMAPDAAALLAGIPYASMAVISYVLADVDLDGSGLLVPPGELPTIKAFTYSSNKWEWIADRASAVFGAGVAVARASVGRLGEEQLLQVDDQQLIDRTIIEARQVPGWQHARPLASYVQRWGGGLPQYLVDHRRRVADIRAAVDQVPGISIAGAYLDGVGLPACIATARQAVEAILG